MNLPPFQLPAVIFAGDSIHWVFESPTYPASDGWTLTFQLRNAANSIDFRAENEANGFVVRQSGAQTDILAAGEYAYRARMTLGNDISTVGQGHITIKPSFSGALDARTDAEKALEAVNKLLAGKAEKGILEYEIHNRKLKNYSMDELLTLHSHLSKQVQREKIAAGSATELRGRKIMVRFGNGR